MTKPSAAQAGHLSVTEVLDLRFLPDDGLAFDEALEPAWLDAQLAGADIELKAEGPGAARLEVQPLGPVATQPPIRIMGEVTAPMTTACVRCLETVAQNLDAKLDLMIFAAGTAPERGAEDEDDGLPAEALDEGSYDRNQIDLPAIVREALLLEIAMNPACEDEAACTVRTNALIQEANREAETAMVDDRWAPLRRLVIGQGEGGSGDPS